MTADPTRPRRRTPVSKIDRLPADVRQRYEREVLSNPATTNKAARDWLTRHGHAVSLATVGNHRRRFLKERQRRAYPEAVEKWTRELAEPLALTEQELAAGAALRAKHELLKQIRAALRAAHEEGRRPTAEQLLAFAAALRAQLGEPGLAATTPRPAPPPSPS